LLGYLIQEDAIGQKSQGKIVRRIILKWITQKMYDDVKSIVRAKYPMVPSGRFL
jgi:hypothetical protein